MQRQRVGRVDPSPVGGEALTRTLGQIRAEAWLPALALLMAATAGALVALELPDSASIGVVVVTLAPFGVLIFRRPARAATLAATLAFVVALIWAYRSHFSPLFAYNGLTDAAPGASAILVAVLLAALPAAWLPINARGPSTILLWALYLVGYVPSILVPVLMNGGLRPALPFDAALLGSMAILALIPRMRPAPIAVPHLSLTVCTRLLAALGLVCLLYIIAAFGVHSPPSLGNVYATRASFDTAVGDAAGAGYIVPWAGNVINPTLMALGLARNRAAIMLLGIFGQLVIYSDTGYKSVLFAVALAPLVYVAVSRTSRVFGLVASLGTTVTLVCAVLGNSITGGWSIALANRTFATPGQVGYYYYDFFSFHQKEHLGHSFLRGFLHSPYADTPPYVIGDAYFPGFHTDANAHVWADAFANFGFGGVIAFTLVLGLVLWIADGLGRGRDARVAGPMFAIAGLSLASSALFTTLMTQGVGLACVLLALLPPGPIEAARPVYRRRVPLRWMNHRAGREAPAGRPRHDWD